jgi:hypothetical protein
VVICSASAIAFSTSIWNLISFFYSKASNLLSASSKSFLNGSISDSIEAVISIFFSSSFLISSFNLFI